MWQYLYYKSLRIKPEFKVVIPVTMLKILITNLILNTTSYYMYMM